MRRQLPVHGSTVNQRFKACCDSTQLTVTTAQALEGGSLVFIKPRNPAGALVSDVTVPLNTLTVTVIMLVGI
jgi:hypothetical protein